MGSPSGSNNEQGRFPPECRFAVCRLSAARTSGTRALFRKEQVSQELHEELNGFLEMAAEEKMKQGMSRKDALRAVRLERGNLEVAKEVVRSASWECLPEMCWQDVRYGLRIF